MHKEIVHILPFFEERMWGGTRLREEFGYRTSIDPIGEVYNVVALPGRADCRIRDRDLTLSELYASRPEWFECDTDELPIRVNILDPVADLSVQLHPDDDYALNHGGARGKPEAWVILDCPDGAYIEFGHHAATREEFARLVREKRWDDLFRYLPTKKDWYIDIPAGTLHAIGKNVLTYNVSRNADCTYRLYDYDRVNPSTGKMRELHVQEVVDNVLVPDGTNGFIWVEPRRDGDCEITDYWDEPGLYTLKRIKVPGSGSHRQERFAFYTVYEGAGSVNGIPVRKGDTILVPHDFGLCEFVGELDLFMASYRNKRQE